MEFVFRTVLSVKKLANVFIILMISLAKTFDYVLIEFYKLTNGLNRVN